MLPELLPNVDFNLQFTKKPMLQPVQEYQNFGFDTLEFLLGMFTLAKAQEGKAPEDIYNPFDEAHPVTITVLPMKTPYYTYD